MEIQEYSENGVAKRPLAKRKIAPLEHFRIDYIPADWHLAEQWEYVKIGLEEVIAKSRNFYTWRPEDVYLALRLAKANLYMTYWDDELTGFGICQQNVDVFGNVPPHFLSWAGYCTHKETRVRYFQELKVIAKSFKLGEIRHASTRHGWLLEPPWGDETETLTAKGWIKHPLSREVVQGLRYAVEFTQRVVVI